MLRFIKPQMVVLLMAAMFIASGCGKNNTPNNGTYNGHEYVDLGLRSGILWATCNVGANTPEAYGDHFAWGETQTKATYDWSTYQYSNGDYNQLTKYCPLSDFGFDGFTDKLVTLESGDDAATVNWGEGWRTPTYKEWSELMIHCTYTWTTQNGVNGCLFTAPNGNSLFLPAADLDNSGKGGSYWSSSVNKAYPDGARGFSFSWNNEDWIDYDIYDFSRDSGRSVRAVYSK